MKKECYTCKYDKDCHWDDCLFGDTPTRWEPAEHYKPDTNADRIRAMSDEELAKWLVKKTKYQESAWSAPSYLNFLTESDDTMESAIKGTTEWLKQPAEEEKTVTEGH